MKAKIAAGIDPVQERAAAKRALAAQNAKALSFRSAAERFISANATGWKSAKHGAQWSATLEKYAHPIIGGLDVAAIETAHVLKILEPIWSEVPETASRVRGRIEAVLDWARARGLREAENPARWKGHLAAILPAKAKVRSVVHHPALPYRDLGAFMVDLRSMEGLGARALEFAILTAARSGEVRGATWREIDLQDKIWIIPGGRMKAGREHRVPLSEPTLKLLEELPRLAGSELIFPNIRGGVLSDMTLTAVIRRMDAARTSSGKLGISGATPGWRDSDGSVVTVHGFRSSFRDWAGEVALHPREVVEHALAHRLADKAEAAYQRGDLLAKRRLLMRDWGKFCASAAASQGVVTPMRRRK